MIRLAVRCSPERAEVVLAELLELAPGGVEEVAGPAYVEYALYGAEGELPLLGEIEAALGGERLAVVSSQVGDDWAERWQKFHRPILIGGRLWVRPSWVAARPGTVDLVIDPGRAFGTGAHPSTRLCLELVVELAEEGWAAGPLSDFGCGSGVIAIAAAKLGFGPVSGYDHEAVALEVAAHNAALNGVSLCLQQVDLREELPCPAPVAVANLSAPTLRALAAQFEHSGLRRMICSGLLISELDSAAASFAAAGLRALKRRREGDWGALLLEAG